MGRLPIYDWNIAREGDMVRVEGGAHDVLVKLSYWKKVYGMQFEIKAREGNRLLRDEYGFPYCIVTVRKRATR